jgi:hypothetical protein
MSTKGNRQKAENDTVLTGTSMSTKSNRQKVENVLNILPVALS